MKKVIRAQVFETNSSSCHSILITKNDHILTPEDAWHNGMSWGDIDNKKLEYMYIDKNNHTANFYDRELEFGRSPFQILTSFEDKIAYAIASFCGDYSHSSDEEKVNYLNEIINIAHEVFPELEDIKLPMKEIDVYLDLNGNELKDEDVLYNFSVSRESALFHFYKDKDGKKHPAKRADYVYDAPNVPGIDHQSATLLKSFLEREHITLRDFLLNKKYTIIITGDEYDDWQNLKRSGLINKDNIIFEYGIYSEWNERKEFIF